ncbi:MAG: class I SAM-dependent methyltransferase [Myxococcota bacterium]
MSTEIASRFWKEQQAYPFPFTNHRRIHELNYLVPRLKKVEGKRLLDLGCGHGALLECLVHLTAFEEFYGFDIAADLLAGINPRVKTEVYDFTQPRPLPEVDVTIIAGVIQYIFSDEAVDRVLALTTSKVVYVRSTCTLKPEDEPVVRDGYASLYRTVTHTLDLLGRHFEVSAVDRVYPDEIESPYGTRQFYFEARRR